MKVIFNIRKHLVLLAFMITISSIFCQDTSKLRGLQTTSQYVLTNKDKTCEITQCGSGMCSVGSVCLNDMACLCAPGFATVPITNDYQCCYEQKKQVTAFLLEFFVSFGAGHWYAMRHDYAGPKLTVFFILIFANIFMFVLIKCLGKDRGIWHVLRWIIFIASVICYLTWQTVDLVYYARNRINDGNGVELQEW